MENNANDGKPFYVVQFIESPFEGIDDYVCVPYSWVIIHRVTDRKVVVAYPTNEDPFDIRDRVKRKERYNDEWRFYMAEIKYESDTYRDADFWIATRSDYGPLVDRASGNKNSQPESATNNKLPSSSRNLSKTIVNLRKLSSKMLLKRTAQSPLKEQYDEKRLKLNKTAQSCSSAVNYTNMEPECSNRKDSSVIRESDQREEATTTSNNKPPSSQLTSENRRQSSPVCQTEKQQPNMPVIDVNGPTEIINIDGEGQMQGEMQPSDINSTSQNHLVNNTTPSSIVPPQPPTTAEQTPRLHQHDHRKHLQDGEKSYSNFQPIITEVRSIREADNDHTARTDEISKNEPYVSHHLPSSLKMSARIYRQMSGRPPLVPMQKPVERRIHFANSARMMTIASQNPSNLMDQTKSSSAETQPSAVTQNQPQSVPPLKIKIGRSDGITLDPEVVLQKIDEVASPSQNIPCLPHQRPSFIRQLNKLRNLRAQEQCQQQQMNVQEAPQRSSSLHSIPQRSSFEDVLMNEASTVQRVPNPAANQPNAGVSHSHQNNLGNFHQEEQRQELRRTSTEGNNPAHRSNTSIKISIPTVNLIPLNKAPDPTNSSTVLPQQRQLPPNHRDLQPLSGAGVGVPRKSHTLQEVTMRSPPPVQPNIPNSIIQELSTSQSNFLLHVQRLEARLQGKSIEKNSGVTASSRNVVPLPTSDPSNLEMPTCSSHQSYKIPLRPLNENLYQTSLTLQRLINQSSETTIKRVHVEDKIVNSRAIGSFSRAADSAFQIRERMIGKRLSPYREVASDSEVVADHEVISDQEMSTGEASFERTNDVDSTRMLGTHIPTSTNSQTHSRFVLEQQMLDHFSTLFTQMGSTLYYTSEMYKNLRGSILETADTYKKLFEVAETFNAFEASTSAASSSRNVAPTISHVTEERQNRVTERGNFSSDYQHGNNDVNAPKKRCQSAWKIVLPPEYDPHDSKWTLKYREIVPGLVELMPQTGIYVSYGKLTYSEQISNDCKKLAELVLLEVFNKNALSVCLSLTEEPQASNTEGSIARPPLDQHASAVLFNYVLRYGLQHEWDIDTEEILRAIDSKIQEIRTKYGLMVEC